MKTTTLAIALTFAMTACYLQAQDSSGPKPREGVGAAGGQSGASGGAQGGERKRPLPPIIAALDANSDGVIDAGEIAKAAESLKKLDKNGDGKLTIEECMPPRPQGGQGQGGQGGPGQAGKGQGNQGAAGGGAQRPQLEK
jgi:hypothetical protein